MPLQLKGIQKIRVVRKDGSVMIYYRHRATGRRLYSDPDSPEYLAEYNAAEAELSALTNSKKISSTGSLFHALEDFKSSESFRMLPLRIRSEFLSVITWLPPEEAIWDVTKITAARARRFRDKAARSRGTRFANYTLMLLQSVMNHCITRGTLAANPVVKIPKLNLTCSATSRRMIFSQWARGRLSDSNSGQIHIGRGITGKPRK